MRLISLLTVSILWGCHLNTIVDHMVDMQKNEWPYPQVVKANFEITDTAATYQVNLKLRINNEYRYSNLFILAHFSNPEKRKTLRYQFKLANKEGQWLGRGSGNIYAYKIPLKTNIRYSDTGKYSISIEQNMRDNPLAGVSDVGVEVIKK